MHGQACCVFAFFQLLCFFPGQSTMNYRENLMVRDRSCTSTELQPFLWKLKVWSLGQSSNKFPIRQEDCSEIAAQSKASGDLPFGSFSVCRGHRTRSVCSYISLFWGAVAWCLGTIVATLVLQGPKQEIFILWVSYLQSLTLQFCNCKQSWITV